MKTLTNNQLCTINLDETRKCLYHHWKRTTENASWNEMRESFMLFLQGIAQNRPKYVIVDERDNCHPFTPEEQRWIDENSPKVLGSAQVERMAIIISKNGFVELAAETVMDGHNAKQILNNRFFPTIEGAEKWMFGA